MLVSVLFRTCCCSPAHINANLPLIKLEAVLLKFSSSLALRVCTNHLKQLISLHLVFEIPQYAISSTTIQQLGTKMQIRYEARILHLDLLKNGSFVIVVGLNSYR